MRLYAGRGGRRCATTTYPLSAYPLRTACWRRHERKLGPRLGEIRSAPKYVIHERDSGSRDRSFVQLAWSGLIPRASEAR